MFETKTEIRRAARQKAIAEAKDEGEHRATERMMSILDKHGIQLPPEAEAEIRKNGNNGR